MQGTTTQITAACHDLYRFAAVLDPSNPPQYKRPGIPFTQLYGLEAGIKSLIQYARLAGIFDQNGIFGQGTPLRNINQDFLAFAANNAQLGNLQKDFFTAISFSEIEADTGYNLTGSIYSGSQLQSTLSIIINIISVYASGDFSDPPVHYASGDFSDPPVHYVINHGNEPNDAQLMQAGAAVVAAGTAMLVGAGGPAVLTGAVIVGAAATTIAFAGVALMAIGVGVIVYGAYRVITQKKGTSPAPWDSHKQAEDPYYLLRIKNRMWSIFPPFSMPPAPPPILIG
jgi:hypothetical protein